MNATIVIALLAASGADPAGPVLVRVSGEARVTSRSDWHRIDLALGVRRSAAELPDPSRLFTPVAGRGRRDTRAVRGEDVAPFVGALHALPWDAGDGGEAYARWLGEAPGGRRLSVTGHVSTVRVSLFGTRLIAAAGTLRATDEGTMGNRFGPNSWKDEWTHRLVGWAIPGPDGRPAAFEVRDRFEVAGLYFNPGGGKDANVRAGTVRIVSSAPQPLSADDGRKLRALLTRLGADEFGEREKAAADLLAWARTREGVAEHLRRLEAAQTDPEVRFRLAAIRKELARD